ncbi:MAG: DNA-3-methyladenine glycosylase [Ilumatobacter sp.]
MAVLDSRHDADAGPPDLAAEARPTVDLGATLAWYRHGRRDLTTRLERVGRGASAAGRFVRATITPHGPGTLALRWHGAELDATTWGPGGDWLLERVPHLVGASDPGAPELETAADPVVAAAMTAHRATRIGASGMLYHELLPTILQQRITATEAKRQWVTLCAELGDVAPGPFDGLRLPPAPAVLARQPSWWFHPRGVERKRAEPMIEVARHATKLWRWAALDPSEAARMLRLVRGIGVWTVGCVLGPALGDPDAVPVGDFHVKNVIAWNLAGEARATDERMLQLLEPYAGQRGRVVRAVMSHGAGAPKFGPRQRILPMARW